MILFICPVTYSANLFGKAFVNVRNCLRKEKHMAQTKLLTDSTRKRHKKEDIASFVQKKKKKMLYRPTPFFNTYTVSII